MRLADNFVGLPDALWPGLLSDLGNCGGNNSLYGVINIYDSITFWLLLSKFNAQVYSL